MTTTTTQRDNLKAVLSHFASALFSFSLLLMRFSQFLYSVERDPLQIAYTKGPNINPHLRGHPKGKTIGWSSSWNLKRPPSVKAHTTRSKLRQLTHSFKNAFLTDHVLHPPAESPDRPRDELQLFPSSIKYYVLTTSFRVLEPLSQKPWSNIKRAVEWRHNSKKHKTLKNGILSGQRLYSRWP